MTIIYSMTPAPCIGAVCTITGTFSIDDSYAPGTSVEGVGFDYDLLFRVDGRVLEFEPHAEQLTLGRGAFTFPELSGPAQILLDTPAYRVVGRNQMLDLFSVDVPVSRSFSYHADKATWTLQQPVSHVVSEPTSLALAVLVLALLILKPRRSAR